MKVVWTLALLLLAGGGDYARGVQLLKEGKFAEAVAALRAAAEATPTDAELQYDLALALWRAGQPHDAEIAAEKAATLSDGALAPLRDGILGNVKMDEAQQRLGGEAPDLQAALEAARRARDHFVHGAATDQAPPELARNLERALKLIADIEKKIEEQKQQQEDQKKDDQKKDDEKKDDGEKDSKNDESKGDDQSQKDGDDSKDDKEKSEQKDQTSEDDKSKDPQSSKDLQSEDRQSKDQQSEDQKTDDPQAKDQQSGDQDAKDDQAKDRERAGKDEPTKPSGQGQNEDKPEPKTEPPSSPPEAGKEPPRPQSGDDDNKKGEGEPDLPRPGGGENAEQPEAQQAGTDEAGDTPLPEGGALGRPVPGRELSPEQTKRLLERLQAVLAQKAEMEKAQKAQRPRVKKDW
ncbi:MAG: tetratricopeptide repeat protein [Planctomycetota bacterium]